MNNESFSEKVNRLSQAAEDVLAFLELVERIAAKIAGIVNTYGAKPPHANSSNTTSDSKSSNTRFFY
jgi:hypothetical protein